jgi:hypothetical protein
LVDAHRLDETDFGFDSATMIAHHERRKDASRIKAARAQDREIGCFWTGGLRGPIPRFLP